MLWMKAFVVLEIAWMLPAVGDHGKKPMPVGSFGSTMVHESAITAIATPFVVVCSRTLVIFARVPSLKEV